MKHNHRTTLIAIKSIHTLIWIFFNVVICYMAYAVIADKMDWRFWLGYVFVLIEGLVLVLFRWTCPISIIAREYTTSQRANFDIYLPEWLAHHTKTIYTSIMLVIVLLTIYRVLI
jgi:hypothetical protein